MHEAIETGHLRRCTSVGRIEFVFFRRIWTTPMSKAYFAQEAHNNHQYRHNMITLSPIPDPMIVSLPAQNVDVHGLRL